MKGWKLMVAAMAATLGFGVAVARADVVIAVAGPMTGSEAAFGEQMRAGAEMAVRDLNAAGGVLGQQLSLRTGDDACDPRQAVSVANQLHREGAVFVAGHFCSSSSIPASEVYRDEGMVQMSPASTNPQLTDRGFANVFRVCGRDDQQGLVAAAYIAEHFPNARIAIIHDQTTYGRGLAEATRDALHGRNITETMFEAYIRGENDYSALVTRLKAENIDVLYIGGYHTEAGRIVRQMREQGLNSQVISGDALVTDEYWSITGPAGEGTLMTFGPDPRNNPAAAEVVGRFRAGGYEPAGYTLYTYAAIQIFVQAATIANSTEAPAVIAALRNNTFHTVIGDISFDEKGDIRQPAYVFYQWRDGHYAQVN